MNPLRKILLLTYFNMCARYRKAWAGFFWVIANPIITFLIQSLVFKSILKIEIANYSSFLVAGLMPWFFISQSLYVVTNCLVTSREILLAFKIHPLDIISSQVLDQFLSFLAAFLIISLFFISNDFTSMSWEKIPLVIISVALLFIFVMLLTILVSFWNVFYRDIQFIVQFVMNLAFYMTPIFYPKELLPNQYHWIVQFNIFVPFIKLFQDSFYQLNLSSWTANFYSAMVIIFSLAMMVYLSLRGKMRSFYINV